MVRTIKFNPADSFLDTKNAAKYLGVSVKTLSTWRNQGRLPRYFVLHGSRDGRKVVYMQSDLFSFATSFPFGVNE